MQQVKSTAHLCVYLLCLTWLRLKNYFGLLDLFDGQYLLIKKWTTWSRSSLRWLPPPPASLYATMRLLLQSTTRKYSQKTTRWDQRVTHHHTNLHYWSECRRRLDEDESLLNTKLRFRSLYLDQQERNERERRIYINNVISTTLWWQHSIAIQLIVVGEYYQVLSNGCMLVELIVWRLEAACATHSAKSTCKRHEFHIKTEAFSAWPAQNSHLFVPILPVGKFVVWQFASSHFIGAFHRSQSWFGSSRLYCCTRSSSLITLSRPSLTIILKLQTDLSIFLLLFCVTLSRLVFVTLLITSFCSRVHYLIITISIILRYWLKHI